MVAVINLGRSIRKSLNYNEQKLKVDKAEFIHSANYAKDTEELGFSDKINRLERLAKLNEKTELNSVHISLNFDPSEKLSNEKLRAFAENYIEKIGFGNQPYLVYKHNDSGHPHIHLLTTNIQADGSRIKMHNIGRNQSEKARKEIEIEFKLVQAQRHQLKQAYELKPVMVQKVQYGKAETKRAITNVLDSVLPTYKYSSLPELNAVLKLYNIAADRGSEDSRTYKSNGLVYRVLDDKGQKIGSPIKASTIYSKPTLRSLEARFNQNLQDKQIHRKRLKNQVDLAFMKCASLPLPELIRMLQKEQIHVVLRENKNKIIYGITYVDHKTKCVFNGSELGKDYSANGLQIRCKPDTRENSAVNQDQNQVQSFDNAATIIGDATITLTELLLSKQQNTTIPCELREEYRRRRKRKRLHL